MKFREAQEKLEKIAAGRYCALHFKVMSFGDGECETECSVYLHGGRYHEGPTWEDAFRSLEVAMTPPIEEIPEV